MIAGIVLRLLTPFCFTDHKLENGPLFFDYLGMRSLWYRSFKSLTEVLILLQLFRQRLSHNSAKAHAIMPIGIIGNNRLPLLGWGSRCLARRKENVWIHVFVLLPSLTPNYLGLPSITYKTIVTHNNFRHCRVHFYAFVRQPFSKQLYKKKCFSFPIWHYSFSSKL